MKNPPVLIAVIGFFAALAGFGNLFFGLRVLGFDWFGLLGNLPVLENLGLWGWLAIAIGIVWLLVALGLWSLQPYARLFTMIVAGVALFQAVLAFFQFPGSGVGFAMAIMPLFILWYMSTSEVRAAFDEEPAAAIATASEAPAPPAPAAPAPAAPAAAPLAVVAAAAVAADPAEPAPVPVAVAAAAPVPAADAPGDEPPATHHLGIEDVEGIGPSHAEKFAAIGITTTDDLLMAGAKPSGRDRIAEQTGISPDSIRSWVDQVDLMRVSGVGPQYSDLLEAGGVGSPAELARRNPANLAITLQEVVAARPGTVRRIPSEAEIAGWIDAAGRLEQVVEH